MLRVALTASRQSTTPGAANAVTTLVPTGSRIFLLLASGIVWALSCSRPCHDEKLSLFGELSNGNLIDLGPHSHIVVFIASYLVAFNSRLHLAFGN